MAGKLFNIRMEEDQRKQIEEQRISDGVTSSSMWAREALAGVVELGGLTALADILHRRRKGEEPPTSPHSRRALALQGHTGLDEVVPEPTCTHPRTAWRQLPYATVCGMPGCGIRMR